MNISEMSKGDHFVECDPEEYQSLPPTAQRKLRRHTVTHYVELCRAHPERVHVRIEAGHWCTPAIVQVTRLGVAMGAGEAAAA